MFNLLFDTWSSELVGLMRACGDKRLCIVLVVFVLVAVCAHLPIWCLNVLGRPNGVDTAQCAKRHYNRMFMII